MEAAFCCANDHFMTEPAYPIEAIAVATTDSNGL